MCWTALWQAAMMMSSLCWKPINQTRVQLCDKGNKYKRNRVKAEISFFWLRRPNNWICSDACIQPHTLYFLSHTHTLTHTNTLKRESHEGNMYHSVTAKAALHLIEPEMKIDLMMNYSELLKSVLSRWWKKSFPQPFKLLLCPSRTHKCLIVML